MIGKEFLFSRGDNGFITTYGELEYKSNGLKVKTFTDGEKEGEYIKTICERPIEIKKDKFEISANIFFDNTTVSDIGGVSIILWNDEVKAAEINIRDAWLYERKVIHIASLGSDKIVYENNSTNTFLYENGSGMYGIIGDGEKASFYWGDRLLGSINYTDGLECNKISIEFRKLTNYNFMPIIVQSVYVGEPLYYR